MLDKIDALCNSKTGMDLWGNTKLCIQLLKSKTFSFWHKANSALRLASIEIGRLRLQLIWWK